MIRLAIVGTGSMAKDHVLAYADMDDVAVVAGIDNNPDNLAAFLKTHGIPRGFSSVEEAIEWGQFDAVSNVTPDAIHSKTTLPLLAAGKHVLCEKPLATNQADADKMAAAAVAAGVVNMVNLSYRNVPALVQAAAMVAEGQIGAVRHFEASYLQSWLTQSAWGDWQTDPSWLWRLSSAHGSMGVLGDVGVHILDYATFAAGSEVESVSCRLKTFDKAPDNQIGDYHLDANDSMAMHVSLQNGTVGVIHATRFASGHVNDLNLRLYGTKGGLEVRSQMQGSHLRACLGDHVEAEKWIDIETPDVQSNYCRFIAAIRAGEKVGPDFQRGAQLQRVLDCAVLSDTDSARNICI